MVERLKNPSGKLSLQIGNCVDSRSTIYPHFAELQHERGGYERVSNRLMYFNVIDAMRWLGTVGFHAAGRR